MQQELGVTTMVPRLVAALALIAGLSPSASCQTQADRLSALARLPVKEVTVFKDGHAYVLHEGKAPVDADGEVRMDYLPTPILGTFWAYSTDQKTPVRKVVASSRRVLVEQTALTLHELILANVGAEVVVRQKPEQKLEGTIMAIPMRSSSELEANDPPNSPPRVTQVSDLMLLRTRAGIVTVNMDSIEGITFKQEPKTRIVSQEFRNLLSLGMPGVAKGDSVGIGLMYVQKGIRWIPSYRVELDGKGQARVRLQATLINEMLDLKDATVHLVIGVPTFAFEQTPDPISLQQTFAQLSPYFDKTARSGHVLSNAIMGQAARMSEVAEAGPVRAPGELPEIEGQGKSEDLFVFTVGNVTLKKGARMVVPVAEFTLPYKDIYTLTIPYAPPPELRANVNEGQAEEIARALAAPRVEHKLRLTNSSAYPLTTAPALIMSDGRVIAQGTMTYTALKASTDLALTTAVDIRVKRSDIEKGRTPNALKVGSNTYSRTDMTSAITITNYSENAVALEVTRYVVGHVDKAEAGGVAENVDPYGDDTPAVGDPFRRWYPWPGWWREANGTGRFTWKISIEPGKSAELGYTWHYFWR